MNTNTEVTPANKTALEATIEVVKHAAATNRFHDMLKTYGTMHNCLRALDSVDQQEAIKTIAIGVDYRIYRRDGRVVVEAK